jgi:predicted nuclease of predicted toxin-antitoxin system
LKLLLDEMWPPDGAEQLRARGHDVVAVAERGDLRKQPDDVIVDVALAEGRVVVTEDVRDYQRLWRAATAGSPRGAGLILTSRRVYRRGDPRTLGRLVNALDALLSAGVEVTSEHWLR